MAVTGAYVSYCIILSVTHNQEREMIYWDWKDNYSLK